MSITRDAAHALYQQHWDQEFTTMEALFARIETLAKAGAYEMCVYVDSKAQYDQVYGQLASLGFDVEHYNGGNNGILAVSW